VYDFVPRLSVVYFTQQNPVFCYTSVNKQNKSFFVSWQATLEVDDTQKIAFWPQEYFIIWNARQKTITLASYERRWQSHFVPARVGAREIFNDKDVRNNLALTKDTSYTVTALATAGQAPFFVMLIEIQGKVSSGSPSLQLVEINRDKQDLIVIPLPPDKKIKKELLAFNADGSMIFIATEEGQLLYHKRIRA
jgi:hypothetical protein